MVSIDFCPPAPLFTSGTTLDCKMFRQSMFGFPSDRHAYFLRCCIHPMRYCFLFYTFKILVSIHFIYICFISSQGRLPYQVKNFVKYIRLVFSTLAPLIKYMLSNDHLFFLGTLTPIY
jgi:hypothetical protein